MLKIARYLKNFKKQVIIGPIFKLTEAVFELIVPLVMAKIIDVGVKNHDVKYVLCMGGVLVLLGVVGLCCSLVCQYNAAKASQGFGTVLRNELFAHINTLSYKELDKFGTPALITRLTNDVNQLQLAVAMLIRLVIRAPFLVVGSAVMALSIDLKLGSIFVIAIPFIVLTLYLVMTKSIPLYKKVQGRLDKISLITRENLVGARVIRAFSNQEAEYDRFSDTTDELKKSAVRVGNLSALLNPVTLVIMNIAIIAIIWFGGYRVYDGILTQGEIIALVNYMNQILLALVVVANLVVIFTKASASAKRINEIFDTEASVKQGGVIGFETSGNVPEIEFNDVSFSFGTGEKAIDNLSVKINKGETVGIIGGTGSGKSTVANLLSRFYDPTEGEVIIKGCNVKDLSFNCLRKLIGIVPQKAVLFSGTIRDNMKWGSENASDEEIIKALKIAQAYEFVEKLPEGLSSPVMQGGKNFSGGQRQRLTIARALVSNPEILILDDSASALDFKTDAELRRAIKKNTESMTVIMISQRATTIKHADKIIVLDEGEVAGIGRHDELLKNCDVYREICLSQLSKEEAAL